MTTSSPFHIKQNDRLPALVRRLLNSDGLPIDLSTALSITFRMRKAGRDTPKVEALASVTDGPNGEVTYQWAVGDTDTPGRYYGEYQVEFSSVTPLTVPTQNDFYITVTEELG